MAPLKSLLPALFAIAAVASAGLGNGSPNPSPNESPELLPRRVSCPDERFKPCGTMCCTPHEHCSYLEMIGYSCFENDDDTPYTNTRTRTATTGSPSQPTATGTQIPGSPAPNAASRAGRLGGGAEMVLFGLAVAIVPAIGVL